MALYYGRSNYPLDDVLKKRFVNFVVTDRIIGTSQRVWHFAMIFNKFDRVRTHVERVRRSAAREGDRIVLAMFKAHYTRVNLRDIIRESTIDGVGSQIRSQRFFKEVREFAFRAEQYLRV